MAIIIVGILASLSASYVLASSWLGRGLTALALVICVAIYGFLGNPGMADMPLAERLASMREKDPRDLSPEERIAMLRDIAQERPDDPQPHYFIGDMYLSAEQPQIAAEAFQTSIRRDPSYTPALKGLADAMVQIEGGRVTQDIAIIYAEVIRREPEDVQSAFMLGMGPWLDGERDLARRIWREAAARMPEESPSKEELGMLVERIETAMANVGNDPEPDEVTDDQP